MGAPAVSKPRPARKPRPASRPRPAAKPRTAAKPRPAAKSRTAAKPRSGSARRAPAAKRTAATKPRAASKARSRASNGSSRRTASAPAGLMVPVAAVGRTAVAVGGIADSPFIVSLTRTRVWIGILGLLLGGIVAINVWGLGLSAGGSATAAKIDEILRENSVLQGRNATQTSNDRIAAAAGEMELAVPAPNGVTYLDAGENDATRAAERLANGKIEIAPPPAPATAEEQADELAAEAAAAEAAIEPVEPVEPVVAPVEPVTTAVDPVSGVPVDPATGLPLTP